MDYENMKVLLRNIESGHTFTKFLKTDDLTFAEPGVGNVNFVLRVSSKHDPKKTVILKYACPYTKVLGTEFPLSPKRNNFERKGLNKLHEICPGQVPEVFHWDKKEAFMIIQDLKHFEDMNCPMMRGTLGEDPFMNVIEFATTLHRATHKKFISETEFEELRRRFRNDEMRSVHYDYIFTCPWVKDEPSLNPSQAVRDLQYLLYGDEKVVSNTHELREVYMTKEECLIHGDMHVGSVMTNGTDVKMIDAEFITVGPPSFDIGLLISSCLYFCHVHRLYPRKEAPNYASILKKILSNIVKQYVQEVSAWMSKEECEIMMREATGFTGCEMCKRIFSKAHNHDADNYPLAEQACVYQGVNLIAKFKEVNTIEDMLRLMELD